MTDTRPTGRTRTTDDGGTVLAFARPPVRQATLVRSGLEHTFDASLLADKYRGGPA